MNLSPRSERLASHSENAEENNGLADFHKSPVPLNTEIKWSVELTAVYVAGVHSQSELNEVARNAMT